MPPTIRSQNSDLEEEEAPPLPGLSWAAIVTASAPTSSRAPTTLPPATVGSLGSLVNGAGGPTDKPPYTYTTLIRCAIEGSPQKRLSLSGIYDAIQSRYPYYTVLSGSGWKNSIRHNLSLNRLFEKKPRAITEPGKGAYWTVKEGVEAGPRRVRKRKPRGKKARALAELEAARLAAEADPDAAPRDAEPGMQLHPTNSDGEGGENSDEDDEGEVSNDESDDYDGESLAEEASSPKRRRLTTTPKAFPQTELSSTSHNAASDQSPTTSYNQSGHLPPHLSRYPSYAPPGYIDYRSDHQSSLPHAISYALRPVAASGSLLDTGPRFVLPYEQSGHQDRFGAEQHHATVDAAEQVTAMDCSWAALPARDPSLSYGDTTSTRLASVEPPLPSRNASLLALEAPYSHRKGTSSSGTHHTTLDASGSFSSLRTKLRRSGRNSDVGAHTVPKPPSSPVRLRKRAAATEAGPALEYLVPTEPPHLPHSDGKRHR